MNYIFSNSGFTVFFGGTSYQVNKEHPNFVPLKEAVRVGDEETFKKLYVENDIVAAAVRKTSSDDVVYENGVVYYKGEALDNSLSERVKKLAEEGFDYTSLLKFIDNLMQNPSANSIKELYDFLAHKNLPITDDGCFLAYKSVRADYMDKYSGTINNAVGQRVVFQRNKVDDDCNKHCSHGLHVGALDYSGPGGWYNSSSDKVVVVKVNPKDAVSVPRDHSYTKLRVCEYEVISDYNAPLERSVYTGSGEYINVPSTKEVEYYETEDVFEGDAISFDYVKSNGEKSRREHVLITEVNFDQEYVFGQEPGVDHPKRFKMDNMSKIELHLDEIDDDDIDEEEYEEDYENDGEYGL